MYIKRLKIHNFRNLSGTYTFSEGTNLILGPNGAGKTSLLEAIAYLSVPRSFRGVRDYALVKWGKRDFFLEADIVRLDAPVTLTAYVEVDIRGNTLKKIFRKDGRALRTYQDIYNTFVVLSFSSKEHAFVDGPPFERRRFFDWALSLLDSEYYTHLVEYNRLLKQKRLILRGGSAIKPVSRSMVEHTDYIIAKRKELVERLAKGVDYDGFNIIYYPSVKDGEEIVDRAEEEEKRGEAMFGPHRDRFEILLRGKSVRYYASEGQKRRIHLKIILFIRELLEERLQDSPVMVLDEPFVYLDKEGIEEIVRSFKGQVFFSSTHRPDVKVEWKETVLGG